MTASSMTRRGFLASAAAAGVVSTAGARAAAAHPHTGPGAGPGAEAFSVRFAPHFGMFRHHAGDDLVDQLEFAAASGFTAWEDNGMQRRPVDEQTRIARAMERLGLEMGVFVINPSTAWGPYFSQGKASDEGKFLAEVEGSVDVAKRVNAKWMTVVLGTRHPRIDIEYQTAYCVDVLRRAADLLEPHGLVMVMEPLNPRDHPNMLLAKMSHAYEICRAVDSPSVKILNDLYHQQITEGNLIPNIDRSWSEIAYFQIGDNPGRREPTTGEINYARVFQHIKDKGFTGILGMEHGISQSGKAGEAALIEAYRSVEPG